MSVELPSHPWWPNDVMEPAPGLLDRAADEHGGDDLPRFLFGWLPVHVFDGVLGGEIGAHEAPPHLWMLHLSGYFGGVWLRAVLDRAQPGAHAVAGLSVVADERTFLAELAPADAALGAATDFDDEVMALIAASLFPVGAGGAVDGLVDSFGYNLGYLLEILDTPPEGLVTPERFRVQPLGPLGCAYATPRLVARDALLDVEASLAERSTAEYGDLAERIRAVQHAAVQRGREVWSRMLSVQGFEQDEYEQLLDVSSAFLEDVQAVALAAAQAVAEHDPDVARRAAVGVAAVHVWLTAYSAGLLEGRGADLPRLVG
jgi:hypothetical protein